MKRRRPPPRPPVVHANIEEIRKLLDPLAEDYVHAFDFGYLTGGSRPEGGGKPTGVSESDPTGRTVIDAGKERAREEAFDASELIADALGDLRNALTTLQRAFPRERRDRPGPTTDFPRVITKEEEARARARLRPEPGEDGWRAVT